MLACLAIVALALVTVRGCRFPPDHPSFSQDSQSSVQILLSGVLHVFTTEFGDCSGCVSELNLCYTPSTAASSTETILTIVIISSDNVIMRTLDVTVDPVADRSSGGRTNCRADGLAHPYCCVTQVLEPSEQFMVNSNFHYAMRRYMGVSSPLVHSSEQTSGYIFSPVPVTEVGSSVTYNSPGSINKPMLYLNLTQGDCPGMIPSPEPSQDFSMTSQKPITITVQASQKPIKNSVQATPTTVQSPIVFLSPLSSDVISHSPPLTEDSGRNSDTCRVSINNSLFVGVGVGGALMVLIMAPINIITVLVCLRRRKSKLNTEDNVAYSSTLLGSLNSNEVYNRHTSSTDIPIPTSTNPAYTEVGSNGPTSHADILTPTNQEHLEGEPHQSCSDTLTYDYVQT